MLLLFTCFRCILQSIIEREAIHDLSAGIFNETYVSGRYLYGLLLLPLPLLLFY